MRPPLVSNVPPPISDHLSKHQNFPTRSPSVLITFFLTFYKQPLDSWCVLALFFAVCTTPLRVYEQLSVEHGTTCTADVTYKLRAINSLPKCSSLLYISLILQVTASCERPLNLGILGCRFLKLGLTILFTMSNAQYKMMIHKMMFLK